MFFEKMQTRKNDGFTLVELIVVIAILAILAGIAVPAYSGYVEKANIVADQQLISEVENALHLAYYSDSNFAGGSVALSTSAAPSTNSSLNNALVAVFGTQEAVDSLRLKSDGWASAYNQSSFYGKETELLGQVDTLTSTLEDAILANAGLVGTSFNSYLTDLGIANTSDNASKVADAAVLYVAQNTSKMTEEQRAQYAECLSNFPSTQKTTFTGDFISFFGNSVNVSSAAALYGFAEAYFQYEAANGKTEGLTALREGLDNVDTTDTTTALNSIVGAIGSAMERADSTLAGGYFAGGADSQAAKDGLAYLDIMDTVSKAEDQFVDKLGVENAFSTTGASLFATYAEGAAVITASVGADGELHVSLPTHP